MTNHEWIIAAGIGFLVALIGIALLPDHIWDDEGYDDAPAILAGTPAPHRDGRENMACGTCHRILIPDNARDLRLPLATSRAAPPIVAGVPAPHTDGRERMVCETCHQILIRNTVGRNPAAPPTRQAAPAIMAGAPSPHRDGRELMVCASCHRIIIPGQ